MTKIKIATTAALAAVALASAGVIAAGGRRPDDPKPAMKPKAPGRRRHPAETGGREAARDGRGQRARSSPGRQARRRGRCERRSTSDADAPVAQGDQRSDGRFSIRLPKPDGD